MRKYLSDITREQLEMLGFDLLELFSAPYMAYSFWTRIDLSKGTVFYRALLGNFTWRRQNSLFLLPPERLKAFRQRLAELRLLSREEDRRRDPAAGLGMEKGIFIDGSSWEVKLYQDGRLVKRLRDRNRDPEWFSVLISAVEAALGREFGSGMALYGELPQECGEAVLRRIRAAYGGHIRLAPPVSPAALSEASLPAGNVFSAQAGGMGLFRRGAAELAGLLLLSDGVMKEASPASWIVYPLREILKKTACYNEAYGLRGIVFSANGAGEPFLQNPDGNVTLFKPVGETEVPQANCLLKFFEPG